MTIGCNTKSAPSRVINAENAMPLAILAAVAGCSLQSFEYLQMGDSTATGGKHATTGGRNSGGTDRGAGTSNAGVAGATLTAGSGGTAPTSGGTTGASGSSGTLPPPCIDPWEFDTAADAAAWQPAGLNIPDGVNSSWIAEGEKEPLGSLVCTATGVANFQIEVPARCADQSHRKLYFRAKSASGAITVKPYAMSSGWKWADGGEQPVNPTTWTNVMLDFDSPAYLGVDYDPSTIINFGVQVPCPASAALPQTWIVWLDRAWLE